ncbi:hypothetical protein [Maritimibacter sp. UBA3975]|uniref:hypothetical protein n=1 Tax=Maritimibacter sp. UBA3975 TaxID=1946833 RepID=UPI000C092BBF|nr:hypothetical protein [Maritimibacter sp. UBA3975]MAM60890.1 hypothetical protein [Maritimibacter sp.]
MRLSPARLSCVLFLAAAPALAQDGPPPISPIDIQVTRLDTIPNLSVDNAAPCCARETFESGEEADFLYLDIDFDVAWSEEVDKLSLSGRDTIFLMPEGVTDIEQAIQAWGSVSYFPEVEIRTVSMSTRRPRNWPDEDRDAHLNAVFTVPAGLTGATLLIGDPEAGQVEVPLDLSGPASELPSAASFWNVSLNGIETLETVETSYRDGDGSLGASITPDAGSIIRLDVTLDPKQNLSTDAEAGKNVATFRSLAVQMVGPEGLPLFPLGEGREIRGYLNVENSVTHTQNWSGEGTSGATDITFYFLGSGASGSYRVFFKDAEVGTIELP